MNKTTRHTLTRTVLILMLFVTGLASDPLHAFTLPDWFSYARESRLVIHWLDWSGSIKEKDRIRYEEVFMMDVSRLKPGDRMVVGLITTNTLTEFRPIADVELPKSRVTRNDDEAAENARAHLIESFHTLMKTKPTGDTAILDALVVSEQLILSDRKRKKFEITIQSDMREDSPDLDIDIVDVTKDLTREIIDKRKAEGLFPDLHGASVYITGATAKTAAKFMQNKAFWLRYIQEGNGVCDSGMYLRSGIPFEANGSSS